MVYNFDKIVDRRNTDSIKYDFALHRGMPKDVLPLWVADMDFQAPIEVIEALVKKSTHGIWGYSESGQDYFDVLYDWFKKYYDWEIESGWLVKTPGVVFAVTAAIRAFSEEGEGVLIQEPVYYPFKESIEINNRKPVVNQLIYDNGKYKIDFEDFEKQIIENKVKIFILCSPHNPIGRVWTKEELFKLGDICLKHEVLVVADEIHADFTYPGYTHHVFSSLKPEYQGSTITCTSPSKTFNLASLQISNIFIANQKLKGLFEKEIIKTGYSQLNIMGIIACKAAYSKGHLWLKELKKYLNENLEFMSNFIENELPQVKLVKPEGTYLVWLDFSALLSTLNLSDSNLNEIITHKAKLWLDHGNIFGAGGEGFQRINIACPRVILEIALKQLADSIREAK